jgi:hypothetical protein
VHRRALVSAAARLSGVFLCTGCLEATCLLLPLQLLMVLHAALLTVKVCCSSPPECCNRHYSC